MPDLNDELRRLDKWMHKTFTVLSSISSSTFPVRHPPSLVCAAFLMRQLNYADAIKTLIENDLPEGALVLSRVMLEGTACLWWVIDSDHREERANNWIKHSYRESLKLPKELEVPSQESSNIYKIKKDAEALIASGEVFKGNEWTIDEKGRKVTTREILEGFISSKMMPDKHLIFRYQQGSGFVHWSTASFPIDDSVPGKLVIANFTDNDKLSCVSLSVNSLGVMTKIAEKHFSHHKL